MTILQIVGWLCLFWVVTDILLGVGLVLYWRWLAADDPEDKR